METGAGLRAAIAGFREAVRANPRDAAARRRLAEAYELRGELGLALREWRRVVGLAPRDAYAYSRLGELLSLRREDASAASCWLRAVQLEPQSAEFRRGLALAVRKQAVRAAAA